MSKKSKKSGMKELLLEGGDKNNGRINIIRFEENKSMKDMPNNKVVTAKYNIFNFLPLNLWNQLSKAQNLYFIMISYMQTIRAISISAGKAVQAAPLIVVMILSILKDLYEDLKRHRQDAEENN